MNLRENSSVYDQRDCRPDARGFEYSPVHYSARISCCAALWGGCHVDSRGARDNPHPAALQPASPLYVLLLRRDCYYVLVWRNRPWRCCSLAVLAGNEPVLP